MYVRPINLDDHSTQMHMHTKSFLTLSEATLSESISLIACQNFSLIVCCCTSSMHGTRTRRIHLMLGRIRSLEAGRVNVKVEICTIHFSMVSTSRPRYHVHQYELFFSLFTGILAKTIGSFLIQK
jgi:hypothetical protein